MKTHGKVFKYGANVDTDVIIPARYLNTSDPDELAAHCMEDLDATFRERVRPGDVIVAGANFGCVIAPSFARIFYRNAINMGLPILESADAAAAIEDGAEVEVDFDRGLIRDLTRGQTYQARPFPAFIKKIIAADGLVGYIASQK